MTARRAIGKRPISMATAKAALSAAGTSLPMTKAAASAAALASIGSALRERHQAGAAALRPTAASPTRPPASLAAAGGCG